MVVMLHYLAGLQPCHSRGACCRRSGCQQGLVNAAVRIPDVQLTVSPVMPTAGGAAFTGSGGRRPVGPAGGAAAAGAGTGGELHQVLWPSAERLCRWLQPQLHAVVQQGPGRCPDWLSLARLL